MNKQNITTTSIFDDYSGYMVFDCNNQYTINTPFGTVVKQETTEKYELPLNVVCSIIPVIQKVCDRLYSKDNNAKIHMATMVNKPIYHLNEVIVTIDKKDVYGSLETVCEGISRVEKLDGVWTEKVKTPLGQETEITIGSVDIRLEDAEVQAIIDAVTPLIKGTAAEFNLNISRKG